MIKKPQFDEKNSDLRSVYYNNYFGMVDGMKYPSNNNRYSGKEKLRMRNSCLQNEEIWVDKLKTGVPDFNRKKYFGSPSSTFINEGTYNNEPVYIKTILAVDLESIKDIKYNIEAYNVMPEHIAEIRYINKCYVSTETDKKKFDLEINKTTPDRLIVVAIEKISSFEKQITKLYDLYLEVWQQDRPEYIKNYVEQLINQLTEACDTFNSYGFVHKNLKYKNIGVRPSNKDGVPDSVVLTDFAEATYMEDIFGNNNYITMNLPFNSLLMCLKLYIKYNRIKLDHLKHWADYFLSKTIFYFKSILDNTMMTLDQLKEILFKNFVMKDLDNKKITEIPNEIIKEIDNKNTTDNPKFFEQKQFLKPIQYFINESDISKDTYALDDAVDKIKGWKSDIKTKKPFVFVPSKDAEKVEQTEDQKWTKSKEAKKQAKTKLAKAKQAEKLANEELKKTNENVEETRLNETRAKDNEDKKWTKTKLEKAERAERLAQTKWEDFKKLEKQAEEQLTKAQLEKDKLMNAQLEKDKLEDDRLLEINLEKVKLEGNRMTELIREKINQAEIELAKARKTEQLAKAQLEKAQLAENKQPENQRVKRLAVEKWTEAKHVKKWAEYNLAEAKQAEVELAEAIRAELENVKERAKERAESRVLHKIVSKRSKAELTGNKDKVQLLENELAKIKVPKAKQKLELANIKLTEAKQKKEELEKTKHTKVQLAEAEQKIKLAEANRTNAIIQIARATMTEVERLKKIELDELDQKIKLARDKYAQAQRLENHARGNYYSYNKQRDAKNGTKQAKIELDKFIRLKNQFING
jgi:hypothetical protein